MPHNAIALRSQTCLTPAYFVPAPGSEGEPVLRPGDRVEIHGVLWIFERRTATGRHVFRNDETGDTLSLSPRDYRAYWREHAFRLLSQRLLPPCKARIIDIPIEAFAAKTQRDIKRRLYYCLAVDRALQDGSLRALSKDDVRDWIKTLDPPEGWKTHLSRGPVMKHYALWKACERRASVLAHGNAGASRASIFGEAIVDIIYDVLETYAIPNRDFSLDDARTEIANEIRRRIDDGESVEDMVPSKSTIASYKQKLDKYQVVRVQDGPYEADLQFEPHGKLVIPDLPFHRFEIDHTLLPVEVAVELSDPNGNKQRIVVGRVWLTAVIDIATRMILAIVVGLEPPSSLRTMTALRQAIEPKDGIFEGLTEIENPVKVAYIPLLVVTDNGKDFHSEAVTAALMDLGVTQVFAGSYAPWHKPFIERFFRSLKIALRKIPGSTPKGARKRGPKRKDAVMPRPLTIEELTTHIWRWICDVYHQRPHAGLYGETPEQAMQKGLQRVLAARRNGRPIQLRHVIEYTADEVDAMFSIRKRKVVDHRGVRYANLYFNSGDLARIVTQTGSREVDIRINPGNLGSVLVWNPDPVRPRWVRVPCVMPFYAEGLTLWNHQRILARLRHHEDAEDRAAGRLKPGRIRSLDLAKYLKHEGALLHDVLRMTGVPARHKRRDLRAAAPHLGRSLDIALACGRLDAIDIHEGRVPPGMGPLIDLVQGDDGVFRSEPKVRKPSRRPDPFVDTDRDDMPAADTSVNPLAGFDPDGTATGGADTRTE